MKDAKTDFRKFVANSDCVDFNELTELVLAEAKSLMPAKYRPEEGIYMLPPDED